MFENLTDKLSRTVQVIRGRARLSEDNIKDAMREVRMALLEADVALPVVQDFIAQVRRRAVGVEVTQSLSPGQALVKVVSEELTHIMGDNADGINLNNKPPVVVLMAGLQGAGKTTTVAKLAKFLKEREKKKVMVVSCDVYRPAAIEQLETVAAQAEASFFPSAVGEDPVQIAINAVAEARRRFADVLLVDTAGRLHIDDAMMGEIKRIHAAISPTETLFVVDAMTGQDAANTAQAFNEALPLTGVVLTKTDGDARGGAALSVRQITGKPIKYLGTGEKLDGLELFHPDRVAQRILGMGDVLSLVEEVQRKVDVKKAQKLADKVSKGKRFSLIDYRDQLEQMANMGGMASLMDKMPGMAQVPEAAKARFGDKQTGQQIAIICSMTRKERIFPTLIKGSRKRRIALGSGTQIQDVNRLLKQFTQAQKMMGKMAKGGMKSMLKKLKGRMPPGSSMPPGGLGF